jgi:hypothetical protein
VFFHQHVVCHQHAKSSVQSRDSLAGHVVTASAYDEQHYVAARFCVNRSVLRKQGLHFWSRRWPWHVTWCHVFKFEACGKYSWCFRADVFQWHLCENNLQTTPLCWNESRALSTYHRACWRLFSKVSPSPDPDFDFAQIHGLTLCVCVTQARSLRGSS